MDLEIFENVIRIHFNKQACGKSIGRTMFPSGSCHLSIFKVQNCSSVQTTTKVRPAAPSTPDFIPFDLFHESLHLMPHNARDALGSGTCHHILLRCKRLSQTSRTVFRAM